MTITNGSLANRKLTIYWVVADVKILPNAPNWTPDADKAVVQIVTRLSASRESAELQMKERLLPLGYELLGLEEFRGFDDMVWPTHKALINAKALYWKFVEKEKVESLQFGKFAFYHEEEDEPDA